MNTHAPEPAPIKICLVADFLLTSPKIRSKKDLASFPMCVISLLISFFKFFSLLRSLFALKKRKTKNYFLIMTTFYGA